MKFAVEAPGIGSSFEVDVFDPVRDVVSTSEGHYDGILGGGIAYIAVGLGHWFVDIGYIDECRHFDGIFAVPVVDAIAVAKSE